MTAPIEPLSLRGVPLFATLKPEQLSAIAAVAEVLVVERGKALVHEDDAEGQGGFFILLEGGAKVLIAAQDGREAILAFLTEGDFFGEMSLLDGDPRSATVRTTAASRVLHIRRDPFVNLLKEYPEIAIGMLAELSLRLRQANRRIEALALMPVNGRVAAALTQIADTQGVRFRDQLILHERPTQAEIAELACTTRETVSRVLGSMQKDGIIAMDGRGLVILDENRLRKGTA